MGESPRTIYFRLLIELVTLAAAAIACVLWGGTVMGILMPFLLAFIMAWAFNPVIRVLQKRLRLTRKLFSYILVLVFYALLFILCLGFAEQVITQLIGLTRSVPGIIAQLQSVYNLLYTEAKDLLALLPPEYDALRVEVLGFVIFLTVLVLAS